MTCFWPHMTIFVNRPLYGKFSVDCWTYSSPCLLWSCRIECATLSRPGVRLHASFRLCAWYFFRAQYKFTFRSITYKWNSISHFFTRVLKKNRHQSNEKADKEWRGISIHTLSTSKERSIGFDSIFDELFGLYFIWLSVVNQSGIHTSESSLLICLFRSGWATMNTLV